MFEDEIGGVRIKMSNEDMKMSLGPSSGSGVPGSLILGVVVPAMT